MKKNCLFLFLLFASAQLVCAEKVSPAPIDLSAVAKKLPWPLWQLTLDYFGPKKIKEWKLELESHDNNNQGIDSLEYTQEYTLTPFRTEFHYNYHSVKIGLAEPYVGSFYTYPRTTYYTFCFSDDPPTLACQGTISVGHNQPRERIKSSDNQVEVQRISFNQKTKLVTILLTAQHINIDDPSHSTLWKLLVTDQKSLPLKFLLDRTKESRARCRSCPTDCFIQ